MKTTTTYAEAQATGERRAADIVARLSGILAEFVALRAEGVPMEGPDPTGMMADAISDAFDAEVPKLAPIIGTTGETCGALASLLFGPTYAGHHPTAEESAPHIAEQGFRIAQVFTLAELHRADRSTADPVYSFFQAAAVAAQRIAPVRKTMPTE